MATASGGLWKTDNAGTTWTPIFDKERSYSIGCVTLDPTNPNVVWVGTGENNSQRSVAFGDGVYKSLDGGQNWENVGLEESEHIGMITIDPRDSNVVYVAAQGPLWRSGGERGVYKTTDGGATWERVLHVSDDTGVNEVHMDPRNPDVLYASSYQRRRHVWTLVDGGPETAIYKSTDAGATWRKLTEGLPKVDMGKIGMAVSPANPDVIYAIIEAQRDKGGTFRSTDRGESWTKMSDYVSGSPQYYNELIADPKDPNRVYSMDTLLQVTVDGGKTFKRLCERNKHVDNHALWIDPDNTDHFSSAATAASTRPSTAAELPVLREPPDHPVLPGIGRQLEALLLRLRRHPGQQLDGRTVAHSLQLRDLQRGLVHHRRRRRLRDRGRSDQPQHRLLASGSTAVWFAMTA